MYAKPSLVFICGCPEPLWDDSHKLAVKGKVFFFDVGLLDLLWSLPGIFACSCTASLRHGLQPDSLANNIGPLQNITSAISVWIMVVDYVCECEIVSSKEEVLWNWLQLHTQRLLVILLSHYMSTQSTSDAFCEPSLWSLVDFESHPNQSMRFRRWICCTAFLHGFAPDAEKHFVLQCCIFKGMLEWFSVSTPQSSETCKYRLKKERPSYKCSGVNKFLRSPAPLATSWTSAKDREQSHYNRVWFSTEQ